MYLQVEEHLRKETFQLAPTRLVEDLQQVEQWTLPSSHHQAHLSFLDLELPFILFLDELEELSCLQDQPDLVNA